MNVRLVDRSWGEELASCFKDETSGLRIICPFIKGGALWQIVGDAIPPDARVITRFSLQDFSAGISDIWALQDVLQAGGEVRGIKGLHAKVFIFGNTVAAVTSANLTRQGLNRNAEFGCISQQPEFVKACQGYFNKLWEHGGSSVSTPQLEEWDAVVGQFLLSAAPPGTRTGLPDYGASTGSPITAPALPDPEAGAAGAARPSWVGEATHGHVKFFGQGDDRAPWSLSVLEEVDASGSHWACTYPKNRRPHLVEDGDVMYLARMVEQPDDYLIYGRAVALAYVDGRDDATADDIAIRPWKDEWPHYIRVHDAEFVAGEISNGIRLSTLMNELKSDSFGSTQENAAAGSGNTNPRMALRQQPAVRLSSEGLAWMNDHFDAALALHGWLAAADIAELDWPTAGSP